MSTFCLYLSTFLQYLHYHSLLDFFCYAAKPGGQKEEDKKPKKAAKSLKVLDPKAGQNLCKQFPQCYH